MNISDLAHINQAFSQEVQPIRDHEFPLVSNVDTL